MPLSCDCYGGCWGDHAKDWPTVEIPEDVSYWELADKAGVPYGSYVKMGKTTMALENKAYVSAVQLVLAAEESIK